MQATIQPFMLANGEGSSFWFFGGVLTLKETAAVSGGTLTWVEQVLPPGTESPYHIHNEEDELFYILEGEISFISEAQAWKASAGSFVFLPRRIPHGFRIEGDQVSRSLLVTTSGEFDQFVRELGVPVREGANPPSGPMDMGKVMSAAARHQLQILGPLPENSV